MNEMHIHEALSVLHDTKALVSNSCWKISSLEEPSFIEDMEEIQRAMCSIEGNFMSLIFIETIWLKLMNGYMKHT